MYLHMQIQYYNKNIPIRIARKTCNKLCIIVPKISSYQDIQPKICTGSLLEDRSVLKTVKFFEQFYQYVFQGLDF